MKKDEIDNLITELAKKSKDYSKEDIIFTDYCKIKKFLSFCSETFGYPRLQFILFSNLGIKLEERLIDKSIVINNLLNGIPYFAEEQVIFLKGERENRYKLIYKISSRYSLIIIIVYEEKVLKVINIIKTSKGAEKLWRKKILK